MVPPLKTVLGRGDAKCRLYVIAIIKLNYMYCGGYDHDLKYLSAPILQSLQFLNTSASAFFTVKSSEVFTI